jgi:signal transduction histidine kinase
MDEFFGAASHRLRGPLNVITGWIGVLRSGSATPAMLEQAAMAMDRSCRAQVELIEGLLELWALSEGSYTIEPVPVDLGQCVRAAVDDTRALAESRRVGVSAQVAPGVTVPGDRPSLERAVILLARHAIARSPEEGEVRLRLAADGARARLEVSDAGPAVRASDLAALFERYRAPEPGGPPHGQINVELAVARRLAALHGGSLAATRRPAGGVTVVLSLPLQV